MVFGGLFVVGGVGKFVMLVGEFFESYDIWWGWCWGGGLAIYEAPSTHKILGMSLAKHGHRGMGHVHWSSQCGTMMS